DVLAQLSPILAWGGLVRTEPVVNLGGYNYSFPGGSESSTAIPGTQTGGLLQQPQNVQQQVFQQVQRNLQNPTP
ncbi:MAG: hypothetical protein O2954_19330, partial [bacterium]|nr:hypothetical protein [bacterium]